jgi:hypothetical protein
MKGVTSHQVANSRLGITREYPSVTEYLSRIAKARSLEAIFESAGIDEKIDIVGDGSDRSVRILGVRGG